MVIIMKISWIKASDDKKSFKIQQNLGLDVYKIEDLETTDEVIKNLIKDDYKTIILSNEVANFSGDIITKYNKNKDINIIIAPKQRE